MNILVLGGTGAMGRPLVQLLSNNHIVYVTSRSYHDSTDSIIYLMGDAHDKSFLQSILSQRSYFAIVDFIVWTNDFEEVSSLLLSHTKQYFFISSARVYAESDIPLKEDSPRLLDFSDDIDFLHSNEYSLYKAREENVLRNSVHQNYTIVRPSITYNSFRLQLGVLELESWLYRALHGRSIVFSNDIVNKLTTMTYGDDVAKGICSLVGKPETLGETFHITYPHSLPWSDVLAIYLSVLEKHLGRKVNVVMTEKSNNLKIPSLVYQVIYSRYFNRSFDNSKINIYCDTSLFTPPELGLRRCLEEFLKCPRFKTINWALEAYNDRAAKEWTPLSEIPKKWPKIQYIAIRFHIEWILKPLGWLAKFL